MLCQFIYRTLRNSLIQNKDYLQLYLDECSRKVVDKQAMR